jgi:hypothetical protein
MITPEALCKKIEDLGSLCTKKPKTIKGVAFTLFKIIALFMIMAGVIKFSYDNSIGLFFLNTARNDSENDYKKMNFSTAILFVLAYGTTREAFGILSRNIRDLEMRNLFKRQ